MWRVQTLKRSRSQEEIIPGPLILKFVTNSDSQSLANQVIFYDSNYGSNFLDITIDKSSPPLRGDFRLKSIFAFHCLPSFGRCAPDFTHLTPQWIMHFYLRTFPSYWPSFLLVTSRLLHYHFFSTYLKVAKLPVFDDFLLFVHGQNIFRTYLKDYFNFLQCHLVGSFTCYFYWISLMGRSLSVLTRFPA